MLIDSHCHLPPNPTLTKEILQKAQESNVNFVIDIGTELAECDKIIEYTKTFDQVYGVLGVFPNSDQNQTIENIITKLEKHICAGGPKIVGIGECGIDITQWENQRPVEQQILLFEKQIELAISQSLPIVIHNRNGDSQVIELLNKYKGQIKGIAHCFDSSYEIAKKYLDLGFYLSFSGFITYNSKKYLLETVEKIPNDRFLVETDSPYIVPKGLKEKQNEPKNVKMIAKTVSQVKNLELDKVCEFSYKNTCTIFNLNV